MTNFSSQEILSFEIIGGVLISGIIYYVYKKGTKLNNEINYLDTFDKIPDQDKRSAFTTIDRLKRVRGEGGTRKKSRKQIRK